MADNWLNEAMGRQRAELFLIVDYMKLFVDRDLNCSRYLVLLSRQYLKSHSPLCQAVTDES
jgi:hypothetical protein